jgi:hypothetical protein
MAQPSDLEARVAALETQVRELAERVRHSEEDAAAARVLAAAPTARSSRFEARFPDFRQATASSFNAMGQRLTDLRTRVNDGFAQVFTRPSQALSLGLFSQMRGGAASENRTLDLPITRRPYHAHYGVY